MSAREVDVSNFRCKLHRSAHDDLRNEHGAAKDFTRVGHTDGTSMDSRGTVTGTPTTAGTFTAVSSATALPYPFSVKVLGTFEDGSPFTPAG